MDAYFVGFYHFDVQIDKFLRSPDLIRDKKKQQQIEKDTKHSENGLII
jgi:hypothetical protein